MPADRGRFCTPDDVARRLALIYPTLFCDAEHALVDTLTGYGNGREWVRGRLLDVMPRPFLRVAAPGGSFDDLTDEELLAGRAADDAAEAELKRQRDEEFEHAYAARSAEERAADDAFVDEIIAEERARRAREAFDKLRAHVERAKAARNEEEDRRVREVRQTREYRFRHSLSRLCPTSNLCRVPNDVTPDWLAAVERVLSLIEALPDDWHTEVTPGEAEFCGQCPEGVEEAKDTARRMRARVEEIRRSR